MKSAETLIVTIAKMVFEKEKPEDFNSNIGMEFTKRAIKYCAANKQYRLIDEWYKMSNAAHHDANYQVDEGTRQTKNITRTKSGYAFTNSSKSP